MAPQWYSIQIGSMYVAGLSSLINYRELFDHFIQFGEISQTFIMRNENKFFRGFGYVTFANPSNVYKAIECGPHYIRDKMVSVYPCEKKLVNLYENKVFVEGIPVVMENHLRNVFKRFGEVKEVFVKFDDTGRAKNYAYIFFEDDTSVDRCVAQRFIDIGGRGYKVAKKMSIEFYLLLRDAHTPMPVCALTVENVRLHNMCNAPFLPGLTSMEDNMSIPCHPYSLPNPNRNELVPLPFSNLNQLGSQQGMLHHWIYWSLSGPPGQPLDLPNNQFIIQTDFYSRLKHKAVGYHRKRNTNRDQASNSKLEQQSPKNNPKTAEEDFTVDSLALAAVGGLDFQTDRLKSHKNVEATISHEACALEVIAESSHLADHTLHSSVSRERTEFDDIMEAIESLKVKVVHEHDGNED